MKKHAILFLLLVASGATAYAQCGKKLILNSVKTEYLDSTNTLQRSMDENTSIEIEDSVITIKPNDNTITGEIKSQTCNWSVPYKEGKTVLTTLLKTNNDEINAILTIEGKDGVVTMLVEMTKDPNKKIRVTLTKFEEISK
jgi:hypothetical protein